MRITATFTLLATSAAFCVGMVASPVAEHLITHAYAQNVPLAPAIIDIAAIKEADLPATPNPDLRSKALVVTDNATLAVQVGNVGKHFHAKSDELQYIVEGTGTAWLGDKKVDIKPGMLIIIPKGTAHAGTVATTGRFKAIAIKIPPQTSGDTTFVE
jgi:mannose-6-phosphate isomerase-like protein (cupin superfamily)